MRRVKVMRQAPAVGLAAAAMVLAVIGPGDAAVGSGPVVGPVARVSHGPACVSQNAEVETAADPANKVLYEEWIGCNGIGFARSLDGGLTFRDGVELPGSAGGWDPAITIGPTGTVYAAFMVIHGGGNGQRTYPVVDISTDHGLHFPTVSALVPRRTNNWGDREFIAVGNRGTIYVTWDYGPHNLTPSDFICSPVGSCSFVAGDINVVIQKSVDGGRTWSGITAISPGFPASGADSAPILIGPRGQLNVLYQGYQVLNHKTLKLGVAWSYFTSSANFGRTWSKPRRLGPASLSMNTAEWWIDGSLGIDSAGNLYATWDTQSGGHDVGWFTYSTDQGTTWSPLVRVTRDQDNAVHIVQVLGGGPGIAYVGWLTDAPRRGYAQYLRVYRIGKGWVSRTIQVSTSFGNNTIWPGDTIGMSLYQDTVPGMAQVAVSWGSALVGGHANSQIWEAMVSHLQ